MNDKEIARSTVLEFTQAMNDWEKRMFIFSRVQDNKHVSDRDRELLGSDTKDTLDAFYYETLHKYCTSKDRKYGGHPSNFGKPTKYSGVSEDSMMGFEKVTERRIEVIAKSDYFIETIYMFVVLNKSGDWKIDGIKTKDGDGWDNDFL